MPQPQPHVSSMHWIAGSFFLTFIFSACGGGSAAAAASAAAGFTGTAYLKTSNTILFSDRNYGLSRSGVQQLVDLCNSMQKGIYGLPPASPPEALMASLDVLIEERYIVADKALTVVTGHIATLPDMQRWQAEMKSSAAGQYPAVPADCSQATPHEHRDATLWRDGLVYNLRYDSHKAIGSRVAPIPPPDQATNRMLIEAPLMHVAGHQCHEIVGPIGMTADSRACVWDLFPYERHLNWPFLLRGRVQFGPAPGLFKTIDPLVVQHGLPIPDSVFEIPADFKVIVH